MVEKFNPASPEQAGGLIEKTEAIIGEKILPPSQSGELSGAGIEGLEAQFPRRYDLVYPIYQKLLQGQALDEDDQQLIAEAKDFLSLLNNLDAYIATHQAAGEQERILRPRQFNVFQDLREFLEQGSTKGFVKLPTGVGKTVVFIEFLEAIKKKTLIVVPTNILLDQTKERIRQFAEDLDIGQINKAAKQIGQDVTVTTYSSLVKNCKSGQLNPTDFKCVIFDEAHKMLGTETKKLMESGVFDHAIQIGFTATPRYSKNKSVDKVLPEEIHSMSIQEAVEEGLLSGFQVVFARTTVDLSKIRIGANGDYDQEELDKAINTKARNLSAVNLYKKYFAGQKLVLYCNSINHAKAVAEAFREAGLAVEAVWGDQSQTKSGEKERQETLKKLRGGEIVGVSNARLLIEGWDDSSVKVCFNLVPTLSLVDAEQRGGRVLRLHGKQNATIVDFLDEADEKKSPITFVEISNAAVIPPADKWEDESLAKNKFTEAESKSDISIEGLTVITDPETIMEIVRDREARKYNTAPKDWLPIGEMGEAIGRTVSTLRRWFLEQKLRERNIEGQFFGRFSNPETRMIDWYVNPILTEELKRMAMLRHRKGGNSIPEDWTLVREALDEGESVARRILRKVGKNIPHYIMGHHGQDYISPEASEIVREELEKEAVIQKNKEQERGEREEVRKNAIENKDKLFEKTKEQLRTLIPDAINFDNAWKNFLKVAEAYYTVEPIEKNGEFYVVHCRSIATNVKKDIIFIASKGKVLDSEAYNKAMDTAELLGGPKPDFQDFMREGKMLNVKYKF